MFTGIIQAVGTVERREGNRLEIARPEAWLEAKFDEGESIAVNGCCLTVVADNPLTFDLSEETWTRTSLGELQPGSAVNLERAMSAQDRFGGHIVQGHVDATAEVIGIDIQESATVIRFWAPEDGVRYLIDKGSITVDGISLTVVRPEGREFEAWIIPHTRRHTNLVTRKVGDRVNLEYDVIAKYVERMLLPHRNALSA